MGNEAWEKAVEAGARAMVAAADLVWDEETPMEQKRWKLRAAACLRAAFPILAEELAALVEHALDTIPHDDRLETADLAALRDRDHRIAAALRARIEQMIG